VDDGRAATVRSSGMMRNACALELANAGARDVRAKLLNAGFTREKFASLQR